MSLKVSTVCGGRAIPRVHQFYGVEIEMENCHNRMGLNNALGAMWSVEDDGSLRGGGVELVSSPRSLARHTPLIHSAYAALAEAGAQGTLRTGIHVHCDMQGRTFEEVHKVVVLYSLLEPVLFALSGQDREENIYCVPWYRAPDQVDLMNKLSVLQESNDADYGAAGELLSHACKYSGLYIGSLRTFGTIELRMLPTFDTPDELIFFMSIVEAMLKFAHGHEDAFSLMAEYRLAGSYFFLEHVFGYELATLLRDRVGELAPLEDVAGSVDTAMLLLATGSTEWVEAPPCVPVDVVDALVEEPDEPEPENSALRAYMDRQRQRDSEAGRNPLTAHQEYEIVMDELADIGDDVVSAIPDGMRVPRLSNSVSMGASITTWTGPSPPTTTQREAMYTVTETETETAIEDLEDVLFATSLPRRR